MPTWWSSRAARPRYCPRCRAARHSAQFSTLACIRAASWIRPAISTTQITAGSTANKWTCNKNILTRVADLDPAFHYNVDPDPTLHFTADPDPAPYQSDAKLRSLIYIPFKAPSGASEALEFFYFNSGYGSSFSLLPMRIRIQLPRIMRIRIQLPRIMRIRIRFRNPNLHNAWTYPGWGDVRHTCWPCRCTRYPPGDTWPATAPPPSAAHGIGYFAEQNMLKFVRLRKMCSNLSRLRKMCSNLSRLRKMRSDLLRLRKMFSNLSCLRKMCSNLSCLKKSDFFSASKSSVWKSLFRAVLGIRWHFGADPYLWLMDPDPTPDPTAFFSDLKDVKKFFFLIFFLTSYPQAHYLMS